MKKLVAMALASMMVLSAVPVMAEEAGFEETPIGEEQDIVIEGFAFTNEEGVETESGIHVAAVYFQPVQMEPADQAGLSVEEANMHIEADISANENCFGIGVGDWFPYLTVDYAVKDADGNVAVEGTFMPMSASDGPHYGANINLPDAGTYTLTFTIHSPAENGYLLHVDEETGPGAQSLWNDPIVVDFERWEYVPQEW